MKNRIHLVLLSVGVSLALLMFVFATAKADITINIIDHFDTSQTVTAIGPNGTDANSLVDPNVLGGERDVQVQVTAGAPTDNINVTTNSGGNSFYSHSQDLTILAWSQIVWDGPDGDPTTIDYTGLGNVDLTNGGLTDRFIIGIAHKDSPVGTISMTVYTDENDWSEYTFAMPALINSLTEYQFPFANFTQGGSNGPADFTHVGAVALKVDGTSTSGTGGYGLDTEIHYVELGPYDWTDLPDPSIGAGYHFATTLAEDGPRHLSNGLILGNLIDFEPNGLPDANAKGDDNNNLPDEDGVVRAGNWSIGAGPISVTVTGGNGCLNAWVDWNQDGKMLPGEAIFTNLPISTGVHLLSINVPVSPNNQTFFALFRLTPQDSPGVCSTAVTTTGPAVGGEVEAYKWSFGATSVTLSSLSAHANNALTTDLWLAGLALLVLAVLGIFTWLRRRTA